MGNSERAPRKRKSQGLTKTKIHRVGKSCLVRIVIQDRKDTRQKIFAFKESQVVSW